MNIFNHSMSHKGPQSPMTRTTSWRRLGSDPRVDWIFILLVAVVISALCVVYGVMAYFDVNDQLAKQSNGALHPRSVINVKLLSDTVARLDSRDADHASAMKGVVTMPDPSI